MREPFCKHFGSCGGCKDQDKEHHEQIMEKKSWLSSLLGIDELEVFNGDEKGYRNRMDFTFTENGLGLRKPGRWWDVVDIEHCPISNTRLNILLAEIRSKLKDADAFDSIRKTGTFMYAVIRTPRLSSSVSFVLNKDSSKLEDAKEMIRQADINAENVLITLMSSQSNNSIGNDYEVIKGSDMLEEEYLGKRFSFHAQGFFQNNSSMAEEIHSYVKGVLGGSQGHLIDLYGGVGTFGIINAESFKSVMVLESSEACIKAAEKNIVANSVTNVRSICGDAKRLREIRPEGKLTIINDPPRSGMSPKVLRRLQEVSPDRIIYVSCNPKHLAGDLKSLSGYSLGKVAMFDMFPQTPHVEAVVELIKDH